MAVEELNIDQHGVPMITVAADGAWSKRLYRTNYSSLSGVAAIVGYQTRKVLFMGVRNKFCSVCAYHQRANSSAPDHQCYKNWMGSLSAMEASIILEGFSKSMEKHGCSMPISLEMGIVLFLTNLLKKCHILWK